METNKTLSNALAIRVYNKIGEEQLKNLLLEGKQLMNYKEIANRIHQNLYQDVYV
jgi:hypothetical protein